MNYYQTNFKINDYISKCDLINKYNYLNTKQVLNLSNIRLNIELDSFKSLDSKTKIKVFEIV